MTAAQFATVEAALGALAHGSPREVIVTFKSGYEERGHISPIGATIRYGIREQRNRFPKSLDPFDQIARIDYADADLRATNAPFYVKDVT